MNLPTDTALALDERRQDSSAVPRGMPASLYADPAMLPVEVERLFINGWICVGCADEITHKWDYYTPDMFNEPLAVVRQTDESPASLRTLWGVTALDEASESVEANDRLAFARACNSEDRDRIRDVQKSLGSHFATHGYLTSYDYDGTVCDFYHNLADRML